MTAPAAPTGYAVEHLRALTEWIDLLFNAFDGDVDLQYLVEDLADQMTRLADDLEAGELGRPTVLVAGSKTFDVEGRLR